MYKIISHCISQLLLISYLVSLFLLLSCTTTPATVMVENANGGEILSGPNKGGVYRFGSKEDAQLAIDFSNAFVNKDYAFLSTEHFPDGFEHNLSPILTHSLHVIEVLSFN